MKELKFTAEISGVPPEVRLSLLEVQVLSADILVQISLLDVMVREQLLKVSS